MRPCLMKTLFILLLCLYLVELKTTTPKFHDCHGHKMNGEHEDKVYVIYPANRKRLVWCDGMGRDSPLTKAWTVIQRRHLGGEDFNRTWDEYKNGFGQWEVDHWIGNDVIHDITNDGRRYVLRIELDAWETPHIHRYAEYYNFTLGTEDNMYGLHFASYSGDAGDSLLFHKNRKFSTPDKDNDEWTGNSCATMLASGWWFADCGSSNLNGQYYRGKFDPDRDGPYNGGIWWFGLGDFFYSFQSVMKIRPVLDDL